MEPEWKTFVIVWLHTQNVTFAIWKPSGQWLVNKFFRVNTAIITHANCSILDSCIDR